MVNNQKFDLKAEEEAKTVDNLRGMVRSIYLKIKEQLDDDSHPIIYIIKKFQEVFKADIKYQLEEI